MNTKLYEIDLEETLDDLINYWHSHNCISYHMHGDDDGILSLREFLGFTEIEYNNYVKYGDLPKNISKILSKHIIKLNCTENLKDKNIHKHRYSKELELLMKDTRQIASFYYLFLYNHEIFSLIFDSNFTITSLQRDFYFSIEYSSSEEDNLHEDIKLKLISS